MLYVSDFAQSYTAHCTAGQPSGMHGAFLQK